MAHLLALDWLNLFGGLSTHQILSVVVSAIIFTIAAGVCLLSLIVFGVRAGLMAPTATSGVPEAGAAELLLLLLGSFFGLLAILGMILAGLISGGTLAEFFLDEPLTLIVAAIFIAVGGLFFILGVGLSFRTVRRARSARLATGRPA
jgi:hypothetical protein